MGYIKDGLNKLYKDEDAPPIHFLALFVLSVTFAISLYPEMLLTLKLFDHSQYDHYHNVTTGISSAMLFLFGLYIMGYNLGIMNNAFSRNKNTVLPEIDGKPMRTIINALPLYLTWWGYYFVVVCIIAAIAYFWRSPHSLFVLSPIVLAFMFILPFVSFVFVQYAKKQDKTGLYGILTVFKYIKPANVKTFFKFLLKFSPLWILVIAFSFITYFVNLPVALQINVTMIPDFFYSKLFLVNTFSAYLDIMLGFLWSYCVTKIFIDSVEPTL